jgi:hypothetical protein
MSLGRLLGSGALSLQTQCLLSIPDAVFTLPASQDSLLCVGPAHGRSCLVKGAYPRNGPPLCVPR